MTTRKTSRDDELEQSCGALPKNQISPLPYRIARANGSGDLLSRSPVHADDRDRIDYGGGARNEKWQNLDRFNVYCGVIPCKPLYSAARENPNGYDMETEPTSHV